MSNPSTNMGLPVPVVGVESGPAWANEINNCLSLIDTHNHSSGQGVLITPSGLNISSDLPVGANNLTLVRTLRLYNNQTQPALGTDVGCLYRFGVDLYFNDGNGAAIRMTQSGAISGTPGSITNLVAPASAAYVSGTQTFVWQSSTNTPANMDGGSFIFRNITASSNGITVAAPAALGSNYTITWPALPGSTLPLSISSAGNMSAAAITRTQLATGAVANTSVVTKTTTYGAASTDDVILCSAGSAFTVTLPSPTSISGKRLWIQKTDSSTNAVTITHNASETINGATSVHCATQYEIIQLVTDGTNWFILSRDYPRQVQNNVTLTINGCGTVVNPDYRYQRLGDTMFMQGSYTCGTVAGTEFSFQLPAGYTIDTTKLTSQASMQMVGVIYRINAAEPYPGSGGGPFPVFYDGSTTTKLYAANVAASDVAFTKGNGSSFFGNGDSNTFQFKIPISGWE